MTTDTYQAERAKTCFAIMKRGGGDTDPRYINLINEALTLGLFKRAYVYYAIHITVALLGFLSSLYFISVLPGFYWQLLNGVWFGFWAVQLGMLSHDLSHGMVFYRPAVGRLFATIGWCFVCGLSEYRWYEKHNKHHESPNHEGHDPDIDIPFIFDEHQLERRSELFKKYVLPYQAYLFWIALPLVYLWNIAFSLMHLFAHWNRKSVIEMVLIITHFVLLYGYVFYMLPLSAALAFTLAGIGVIGLYMSLVFAPNHKSEDITASDSEYSWVSQITSTRNVSSGYWSFFLFGGLNFQVEHHLFPTMARSQYFKANKLVKEFCAKEGILYEETSWFRSMADIHALLKAAGK
jgi:fatty acid desaturase